jgi:hypothetical protein
VVIAAHGTHEQPQQGGGSQHLQARADFGFILGCNEEKALEQVLVDLLPPGELLCQTGKEGHIVAGGDRGVVREEEVQKAEGAVLDSARWGRAGPLTQPGQKWPVVGHWPAVLLGQGEQGEEKAHAQGQGLVGIRGQLWQPQLQQRHCAVA